MTQELSFASMAPDVAKAVIKVKGGVTKLVRDARNPAGGFNYVSKDAFYEMIRPLEAEAGLLVLANELEHSVEERTSVDRYGNKKSNHWLTVDYALFLIHESGATFGPVHRSSTVLASGPQAYGAAEAYVLKYFACNLYKIPTGEADGDAHEQDGLPINPANDHPAKKHDARSQEPSAIAKAIVMAFEMADCVAAIDECWRKNNEAIKKEDQLSYEWLKIRFKEIKTALKAKEAPEHSEAAE